MKFKINFFLIFIIAVISNCLLFGEENKSLSEAKPGTLQAYENFTSCIYLNDEWFYGGEYTIPLGPDLTDIESINEAEFAAQLQVDLDHAEKRYCSFPATMNGKILDTDIARNLYLPYHEAQEVHKLKFERPTLYPAAWFVDYLYYKKILELAANKIEICSKGFPFVVLLAGGDGSGKTSSIKRLNLSILDAANLIKDSTLSSDFEDHRAMVEQTLNMGLGVVLIYVFRPVELALETNVQRALKEGRVRPLIEIVEAHYKAQQNLKKLDEYFGRKIAVMVIDNSGSKEETRIVDEGIAFLDREDVMYKSKRDALERALKVYKGLDKEKISQEVVAILERKLEKEDLAPLAEESEKRFWYEFLKEVIGDIAKKFKQKVD